MPEPHFSSQRLITLIVVSIGIWGSFAWWSVLQERLITRPYTTSKKISEDGGYEKPTTFHFPFFLNLVSYVACCAVAGFLNIVAHTFGWATPWKSLDVWQTFSMGGTLSLGTVFGYSAMKRLSYPVTLSAKMCKSIPTMIIGFVVYRQRYQFLKVVGVLFLTFGVLGFSLFDEAKKKKDDHSSSLIGLGLIGINLLFDGYTQSSQDSIIAKSNAGSLQMMFVANGIAALFATIFLTVGEFVPCHKVPVLQDLLMSQEFSQSINFLMEHPQAFQDLANMAALGAVGQVFIFAGIANFGTLTVMGLTVSRKIVSILISIYLHDHNMNNLQALCLAAVVVGILIDSYLSVLSKKKNHHNPHHKNHQHGEGEEQQQVTNTTSTAVERNTRNTTNNNNARRSKKEE